MDLYLAINCCNLCGISGKGAAFTVASGAMVNKTYYRVEGCYASKHTPVSGCNCSEPSLISPSVCVYGL